LGKGQPMLLVYFSGKDPGELVIDGAEWQESVKQRL
jgi:hypothetical protein